MEYCAAVEVEKGQIGFDHKMVIFFLIS